MKPNQIFCRHKKSWIGGKYTCEKCHKQFGVSKEYFRERRQRKIKEAK